MLEMEGLSMSDISRLSLSPTPRGSTEILEGERKLFVLVEEASGLSFTEGGEASACVSLECFNKSVRTTCQLSTRMPLWNEILEIAVPQLPTTATLRLNRCCGCGEPQCIAKFEILVTEDLDNTFYDERLLAQTEHPLSGTRVERKAHRGCGTDHVAASRPCRLHVACSLNRDFIESCRRGLWPSRVSVGPDKDLIALAPRLSLAHQGPPCPSPAPLAAEGEDEHRELIDEGCGPTLDIAEAEPKRRFSNCRSTASRWFDQASFRDLSGSQVVPVPDNQVNQVGDSDSSRRSASPALGRIFFHAAADRREVLVQSGADSPECGAGKGRPQSSF